MGTDGARVVVGCWSPLTFIVTTITIIIIVIVISIVNFKFSKMINIISLYYNYRLL